MDRVLIISICVMDDNLCVLAYDMILGLEGFENGMKYKRYQEIVFDHDCIFFGIIWSEYRMICIA